MARRSVSACVDPRAALYTALKLPPLQSLPEHARAHLSDEHVGISCDSAAVLLPMPVPWTHWGFDRHQELSQHEAAGVPTSSSKSPASEGNPPLHLLSGFPHART